MSIAYLKCKLFAKILLIKHFHMLLAKILNYAKESFKTAFTHILLPSKTIFDNSSSSKKLFKMYLNWKMFSISLTFLNSDSLPSWQI
jgi:hypothetical protein